MHRGGRHRFLHLIVSVSFLHLKLAHSIREASFAHVQSDYDTLLGPVERNVAAKLRGHTPVHQFASESLELYGRHDRWAAPFGPQYYYFIIIRIA